MKNLKEFKELMEWYNSISLEEVDRAWTVDSASTARNIIGFGDSRSCSLCRAVHRDCLDCVWSVGNMSVTGSCYSIDRKSYNKILESRNPWGLVRAFRRRAKLMMDHLNNIKNDGISI